MVNTAQNDAATLNRIDGVKIILKTLSDTTGLPYSIVARVTEDSWTACAIHDEIDFGLNSGDELVLSTTYCNTVTEQNAPLLIRHASEEPEFREHPALANYAVESYLGVPLFRKNGEYFGVLCSLDVKPNNVSDKSIELFRLMANLIAFELEAEEQRVELEEALRLATQTSEVRARFMGILGHDLRNPLNTITMAAHLLIAGKLDAKASASTAEKVLRSSRRMQFMIEDLLDASQTAQDNKILIDKKAGDLAALYERLIEEFRVGNPNSQIHFNANDACAGQWDEGRLGQVLSNLLSNALSHGSKDDPINVSLSADCDNAVLKVNNQGEPMSDDVRKNLFTAFWRGAKRGGANSNSSGLGLGLSIVKQILDAHGGTIGVESTGENGTTFTVILPRE